MNNEKIDALSEQQIEALNRQLADIGDDEVFRERWLEAYSNRLWATVNKERTERQRAEAELEELRSSLVLKDQEISHLESAVDEWQESAMLNNSHGDSEGITPFDNERQVLDMRVKLEVLWERAHHAVLAYFATTGHAEWADNLEARMTELRQELDTQRKAWAE